MVKLVIMVIYVIVTLICVGVSVWSSFNGFKALLDNLAIWVALATGLMLFAGDMAIQQSRERGRPIGAVLAFMFLPFAASFSSNFNYFYTNAMRERVAADQLELAHQRFDEIMQSADLALRTSSVGENTRQLTLDVNAQMRALEDQIDDPLNPGLGREANGHVDEIYALLPGLTSLDRPDNPRDEVQVAAFVENLQRIIDRELVTLQNQTPIQDAIETVDQARAQARTTFDTARSLPLATWEPKIEAVAAIAQDFRDVMPEVNTALREARSATLEGAQPIDEQDVLLGEIAYSFSNGFQKRPSPGTTLLSSAAAMGIDIMPILFALALFHRRRDEDEDI